MKTRTDRDTVGAFDAKTRLSDLLDRVEAGEVIVITRHGSPIAPLQPYAHGIDTAKVQQVLADPSELRAEILSTGHGLTVEEIRAAIEAGRE